MFLAFATFLVGILGCSDLFMSEPGVSNTPVSDQTSSTPSPSPTDAQPIPARVAVRHILIAYEGAQGAPMGTQRSRKEALERANELRTRILGGESMPALAQSYSNDSSKARGGFLGSSEKGAWVPAFENAAFALEVDGLSKAVETPFGYHIIRREALQEVRLLHMVMQYQGALNLSGQARTQKRSRAAAQKSSSEALALLESGEDFESVAEQYSDGPMGKRGADLGWFTRGEIGSVFDEAVFALSIKETSAVIESPFGFHIVKRIE